MTIDIHDTPAPQDDLTTALQDIAKRQLGPAPNEWDKWAKGETHWRGTNLPFDYEVYDHGDTTVLYPVANNAREWLYAHLPADCPRWGAEGWVIENRFVTGIMAHMTRDKVISEDEYTLRMEVAEEQNQMAGVDVDWAEYEVGDR